MINKRLWLLVAAGLLSCSIAAAAPGKFSVQADELDYDMKTGVAVGKGHVIIIQEDGKATADHATYNSKTKSGVLKGNVVADRGTEHLSCDELIVENDENFSAVGNAVFAKDGKRLYAPRVNYGKTSQYAETLGNWALLTDVDGSTLNAVKIVYDGKVGIATATGGVTVNSDARKLKASADKAIYDTKKDGFVELIGNATATQDGNTVKGDKLRLTNTNVAVGDGNVSIKYIPEQKNKPGQKAPAKQKETAVAVEPAVINKETEAKA